MRNKLMLGVGVGVCAVFFATAAAQSDWHFVPMVQVESGLQANQYHARALGLMELADTTYSPDFFDQFVWQQALAYANAALQAEPSSLQYLRTMAVGYTRTQFWAQAYNLWRQLEQGGDLKVQDRPYAALAAAKMGYLCLTSGAPQESAHYFEESLRWQEQPQVRALLERVQTEVGGQ
ncbi:MAG: hypothetical protein SFU83_00495 [Meiothermus sp.]|nr:hypothetical protein [Meiothermus sp.]